MWGGSSPARWAAARRRRQPTGAASDRLEDAELIDPLHVASEQPGLHHAEGDVPRRTGKAGRVVGAEQVVVDRLGNADPVQFVAFAAA